MDTTAQQFISDYKDALESTPEEVRQFLWSDAYKGLIDAIAKYCNLTDPQKEATSDVLFDIVINAIDEDGAEKRLTDAGISKEVQGTIFSLGYKYFVELPTQLAENKIEDIDAEPDIATEEKSILPTSGPTISQSSLTSIADRLKQTSISTPTAHRAIDPYHESIDNE